MNTFSRIRLSALATVVVLTGINPVFAGGVARLAVETGGETIIEVETTDDDSEKLKGGGLAHIEFGFQGRLLPGDPAWETEGTVGYKADNREFENGDMSFTRVTVNLMQYYRISPSVRLGAGATYHMNGNVDVDIPAVVQGEVDVDNALGFMVAADYTLSRSLNIGVRYTQIDYEATDFPNADSLEGNSFGGYVSLNF